MTAADIIRALNLEKLEPEGGYFRQTHNSKDTVTVPFGNSGELVERRQVTCIYYLVTDDSFSAFHKLKSTEVYNFYLGARLELTLINESGEVQTIILGPNIMESDQLQAVVAEGIWQAARILPGETQGWSLIGTTVTPGFEFEDFELAEREQLIKQYPQHAKLISRLTRS